VVFLFFKKIHAILGREGLAIEMLKVKTPKEKPKKKRLLFNLALFMVACMEIPYIFFISPNSHKVICSLYLINSFSRKE